MSIAATGPDYRSASSNQRIPQSAQKSDRPDKVGSGTDSNPAVVISLSFLSPVKRSKKCFERTVIPAARKKVKTVR